MSCDVRACIEQFVLSLSDIVPCTIRTYGCTHAPWLQENFHRASRAVSQSVNIDSIPHCACVHHAGSVTIGVTTPHHAGTGGQTMWGGAHQATHTSTITTAACLVLHTCRTRCDCLQIVYGLNWLTLCNLYVLRIYLCKRSVHFFKHSQLSWWKGIGKRYSDCLWKWLLSTAITFCVYLS
jgi:hypothetical protein